MVGVWHCPALSRNVGELVDWWTGGLVDWWAGVLVDGGLVDSLVVVVRGICFVDQSTHGKVNCKVLAVRY